ncbi:uncharacterized protein LOC133870486 isoform X6 [Alnus glutinosa]|uniref:uncharacterized protein LOC133870486 isoform X6 n=1 Tax=Alnus glutinosa TaxID=3517 RepID=UPI002D779AB9|nr:uncharacterized protein LOC133870486 isoform X6 [Alnus glutinosa]
MLGSFRNPSQSAKKQQLKQEREWLALSFRPENFIPGLVIGFIFGLLLDLSKPSKNHMRKQNFSPGKPQQEYLGSNIDDQEMKMVCPNRPLLRQWEQCGQPKIVVTCKNQQEMNKLKDAAETIGLPTFNVADAGRTQVLAGSKTVLAIGPGPKASVDSVTGKLCLL